MFLKKICLLRLAHPFYGYRESAQSECIIVVNNSYSFVDKEPLYATLYSSTKIFGKIRFLFNYSKFFKPPLKNIFLTEFDRKGYVTKAQNLYFNVKAVILSPGTLTALNVQREVVFQWANPHHQCSHTLKYL